MIKAVRGAFSIDIDNEQEIKKKTFIFLDQFFTVNKINKKNIIQIIISSTNDIHSAYPCKFVREYGINVPLLCVTEQSVKDYPELIIRFMFLVRTFKKLKPVYLDRARSLIN